MHSASLTVCDTFRFNTAICWSCLFVAVRWNVWCVSFCGTQFSIRERCKENTVKVWSLDCQLALSRSRKLYEFHMQKTFLFDLLVHCSECVVSGKAFAILQTIFHHFITVSIHSNHRFGAFSLWLASESSFSSCSACKKATSSRWNIVFISFAHQWVHAHLVNFPSKQRTRVESGWTISTLFLHFFFAVLLMLLLLLYIDRVHTTLSTTKRRDAHVHRSNDDALIYPAILHWIYFCVLSNGKQFDQWYYFHIFTFFRVTWITCIVWLKGAISLASAIALTSNSVRRY